VDKVRAIISRPMNPDIPFDDGNSGVNFAAAAL
jgi:hypothetical protein